MKETPGWPKESRQEPFQVLGGQHWVVTVRELGGGQDAERRRERKGKVSSGALGIGCTERAEGEGRVLRDLSASVCHRWDRGSLPGGMQAV